MGRTQRTWGVSKTEIEGELMKMLPNKLMGKVLIKISDKQYETKYKDQ